MLTIGSLEIACGRIEEVPYMGLGIIANRIMFE